MAVKKRAGSTALTYKIDNTTITYDADELGGSSVARKDNSVSMSDDDTVKIGADGDTCVGFLNDVYADDTCSVTVEGYDLDANKGTTALGLNQHFVCAGNGLIKPVGSATNGRGVVVKTLAAGTAGKVRVNLP